MRKRLGIIGAVLSLFVLPAMSSAWAWDGGGDRTTLAAGAVCSDVQLDGNEERSRGSCSV